MSRAMLEQQPARWGRTEKEGKCHEWADYVEETADQREERYL